MFVFRAFMTVINIFMVFVFLAADVKTKTEMRGCTALALAFICNTILIWS